MKIKINKIEKLNENELLKRVEYRYGIDDSSGLLKIELTMYNEMDEIDYFMNNIIPNLYKYDKPVLIIYYYKNFKYSRYPDGRLEKFRMY